MVHSTWDDWLVDDIEGADPDGLSVWYLGCNVLAVRTPEATVYVDPYFGDGDPPRIVRMIPVPIDPADTTADAVFCSHEHIDHVHPPSYGPLLEGDGELVAPAASFEQPDYDGDLQVPPARRRVVTPGDAITVGDLTVHVRGANDPDAIEPVSYVFEHDSGTLFHPGDSRPAPEAFPAIAAEFDIDLGVLAVGTVGNIHQPDDGAAARTRWYMDENQAIKAANQLELDRLLPTHYDMWRGVGADPKVLHEHAASFEYPRVLEVARIGDRLDIDRPGIVRSATQR